jgi:hypothetical protein
MKFIVLLFSGLLCFTANAQLNFTLVKTLEVKAGANFVRADQFSNIYLVYDEELVKLSPTGKKLYSYSDPLYGDISNVDALNAMNPLVFYNDVNQLRLVDNRLNESQAYNLLDAGFIDPAFVAYTDEDNVWIYDQVQDKLVRYNLRHQEVTAQSQVITQITNTESKPSGLYCSFNKVVLEIPGHSALIFDALGAYQTTLSLSENTQVSFYNLSLLSISKQGGVALHNLKNNQKRIGLLPEKDFLSMYFEGNLIYLLFKNEVKVYQVIAQN